MVEVVDAGAEVAGDDDVGPVAAADQVSVAVVAVVLEQRRKMFFNKFLQNKENKMKRDKHFFKNNIHYA